MKLKLKDKIEKAKFQVKMAGYEEIDYYHPKTGVFIGTLYIKDKMDYGFHVYFIHEPNSTPLAGTNGTLSEMYYDLRHRVYWIKRNLKEVKFSVRNVDSIFPQTHQEIYQVFEKLSTPNNIGLYKDAFEFLGAMDAERTNLVGRFFHRLITEYSYFELLHKAGIKVTEHLHIENPQGTSPREILGLSKTQWKIVKKYNVDANKFKNIKYKHNEKADHRLLNLLNYVEKLEREYGVQKIQNFVSQELNYIYLSVDGYYSALRVAQEYNLPVNRFIRYIYFECDVSQGLDSRNAVREYADYIRMATEMGYERFDRYPKFLRTYHDITARNYRVVLDEIQLEQWNKAYEKNKKYTAKIGEYVLFPPKKPEDLVREGNVLGHCVGSYVNKVREGLSTIVFLREEIDTEHPLVTVEIQNDTIVQARGKMNNLPTAKQVEILRKFASKFNLEYYTELT